MRRLASVLVGFFLLAGPASAFALPEIVGNADEQTLDYSGDPKKAFDAVVRALTKEGHAIASKERDAGAIETEWEESYKTGLVTRSLLGASAKREYKLSITIDSGVIRIQPHVRVCTRVVRDPETDCKAVENLSDVETAAVEGLTEDTSESLAGSKPSFFAAAKAVDVAGPGGARVGDKVIAVNSSGRLFSGDVVNASDAEISIQVDKGTVVTIQAAEISKMAVEPKPTPPPAAAGARPTGKGPIYITTARAGNQEVSAGKSVKINLTNGNSVTGTVTAVSREAVVLDVGTGGDGLLLQVKEINEVIPW
jgi:hypothetical protein